MTKVFISWSGKDSQQYAELLHGWLPSVLQFAEPYFTPKDVEKGVRWNNDISEKLETCDIGLLCLTQSNLESPWILFEAGALSKNIGGSRVTGILFGFGPSELTGPLATFQNTPYEKRHVFQVLEMINQANTATPLSREGLSRAFEKWWPDLEAAIAKVETEQLGIKDKGRRPDSELIEEILILTRGMSHRFQKPGMEGIPHGLIRDSQSVQDALGVLPLSIGINFDEDDLRSLTSEIYLLANKLDRVNRYLRRLPTKGRGVRPDDYDLDNPLPRRNHLAGET